MKQTEKQLHSQVCGYLKLQYPEIIFNTDASGIKLTIGQAVQMKKLRSNNGFPDIVIYEQRKGFNAFFIELKADGVKLHKKDGSFTDKHIEEQYTIIRKLRERGYYANFAIGFENAKSMIDNFLQFQ